MEKSSHLWTRNHEMKHDSKIVGRLNIGFPFTGRKLNVDLVGTRVKTMLFLAMRNKRKVNRLNSVVTRWHISVESFREVE